MPNGTVKFFNAAKGFGFITPDDGGKDVFVPTASSNGVSGLKAGQRVTFETQPDTKGPKAVNLVLLSAPPAPKAQAIPKADARIMVYCDPDSDMADDVLAEIRRAGQEPGIVNTIAEPPTRDELKRLSMLLKDGDQSLVKKYDALFRSLQLDDRFLSENEFWDSVVEHPSLIDGPIVAGPAKARICRSKSDVKAFLTDTPAGAPKSKGLSPRLLRLMAGESVPAAAPREKAPEKIEAAPVKASVKVAAKAKPAPKPAPVKKAAAKPKPVAKKTIKAPAKKPAKGKR